MTSAFSSPPTRCSSPAVPGTAQGRARVSGSRRYGRNCGVTPSLPVEFGSVEKAGSTAWTTRAVGTFHGSEPLAR